MSHEFFSINSGPTTGSGFPEPGIMTVNGTAFNNIFFPFMLGLGLENTSNNTSWWPFDRGIQAPSPTTWGSGKEGVYFWHKNNIYLRDGLGNWDSVHMVANQQNVLDYGIHSGLYSLIGRDGRLYVAGLAPSATGPSNTVGIRLDVASDAWSEVDSAATPRMDNVQICYPFQGDLWAAGNGNFYRYDVASNKIYTIMRPGDVSYHYRFFNFGSRFFVAGPGGLNIMKVWEYFAGIWVELLSLGAFTVSATGLWDLMLLHTDAYLIWNSNGGGSSGYRFVKITPVTTDFLTPLTNTELTDTVLALSPYIYSTALNNNPNGRLFWASDGNSYPELPPRVNLYHQPVGTYSQDWDANRWLGDTTPLGDLGDAQPGTHTYVSNRFGSGDGLFHSPNIPTIQQEITIYRLVSTETDALAILFWCFGLTRTGRVKLWITTPEYPLTTPLRYQRGQILSVTGGTLNVAQNRMDNVPISPTGGGTLELVWDRDSDDFDLTQLVAVSLELEI